MGTKPTEGATARDGSEYVTVVGTPGWVQNDTVLDLDFERNRGWATGLLPGLSTETRFISFTRNTPGWAEDRQGNWIQFGNNVPRVTNKGLLVEMARTNSIRNNIAAGATVGQIGAGGAYPTNWGNNGSVAGVVVNIVGTGTENGMDYIDIRFSGTPGANGDQRTRHEPSTQIVAANGQTWAYSVFIKRVAGTNTGITTGFVRIVYRNGGVGVGSTYTTNFTPTTAYQRLVAVGAADAVCDSIDPEFALSVQNGVAMDITLRIAWPQAELATVNENYATSPIRTTGSTVARNQDDVLFPTYVNTLLQPGGVNTGTYFLKWHEPVWLGVVSGGSRNLYCVRIDGSNQMKLGSGGNVNKAFDTHVLGGSTQFSFTVTNTTVANTDYAHALAVATNDAEGAWTTSLQAGTLTDSSVTPLTGGTPKLGLNSGGGEMVGGYIRRFAFSRNRKASAVLTAWCV